MTTKAKKKYYNFKFKPRDTILLGRESEGVPKIVHDDAYQRLIIPLENNKISFGLNLNSVNFFLDLVVMRITLEFFLLVKKFS